MSLDLVLYVAFGGGFVAGRLTAWRSPWVDSAAMGAVGVLLFLLGVGLGSLPAGSVIAEIPLAAGFALATLAGTLLVMRFLEAPRTQAPATPPLPPRSSVLLPPVAFVAALLVGVAVGASTSLRPGPATEYVLYGLLALVGFGLELDRARLRSAWRPIAAAVLAGVGVATVFAASGLVPPVAAYSSAFAFGWYSLAGPLVGARLGAALGLFAFLANFFRENVTMLSAPVAGPRVGGDGLASMGGATSMDTTLFFVTRFGGRESATVALATGIVLTTVAGVVVPLILALA